MTANALAAIMGSSSASQPPLARVGSNPAVLESAAGKLQQLKLDDDTVLSHTVLGFTNASAVTAAALPLPLTSAAPAPAGPAAEQRKPAVGTPAGPGIRLIDGGEAVTPMEVTSDPFDRRLSGVLVMLVEVSDCSCVIDVECWLNVCSDHLWSQDNLVNQRLSSRYLAKLGITHDIAPNGLAAFNMFRSHRYPLILMYVFVYCFADRSNAPSHVIVIPNQICCLHCVRRDLSMPVMDGITSCQRIMELCDSERSHRPWVVSMSASTSAEVVQQCREAGMSDFLNKPTRIDGFQAMLVRFANRTSSAPLSAV